MTSLLLFRSFLLGSLVMTTIGLLGGVGTVAAEVSSNTNSNDLCMPPANNVFHVQVDVFASALGHYTFAECGDTINPTLGLRRNQTYKFIQSDRTNYYHPMGIISGASSSTGDTGSDTTTNNNNSSPRTTTTITTRFFVGPNELGREYYERRFVESTHIWAGYDDFSVSLTINGNDNNTTNNNNNGDNNEDDVLLYECLIHAGMEGRIVILNDDGGDSDTATSAASTSVASSSSSSFVDDRSEFDRICGTYGLNSFQLPNGLCPDRFVCGTDAVTDELQSFAKCLEAANCAMMSGMTTAVQATDDSALFIHQMIPHHENAVNTAKTLLKTGNLLCPDLTDQSNPDCVLESILLGIISGQNHQIQLMRKFLSDRRYPQEDNCDVYVRTVENNPFLNHNSNAQAVGVNGADETQEGLQNSGSARTGAALPVIVAISIAMSLIISSY